MELRRLSLDGAGLVDVDVDVDRPSVFRVSGAFARTPRPFVRSFVASVLDAAASPSRSRSILIFVLFFLFQVSFPFLQRLERAFGR
jgi:hypothetical protein